MDDAQFAQVNVIEGDITDAEAFDAAIVDNGITNIIHLAALQVPMVRANPILGMRVNVVGSTIVFETAKQHMDQVRSAAYASSIAVYGPTNPILRDPSGTTRPCRPPPLRSLQAGRRMDRQGLLAGLPAQDRRPASFLRLRPGRDQGVSSMPTKAMLAGAIERPYNINFGGNALISMRERRRRRLHHRRPRRYRRSALLQSRRHHRVHPRGHRRHRSRRPFDGRQDHLRRCDHALPGKHG
ncbi:MAG: NAD-dependent epimerase/dehydratase family protein [Thermomicrobiales bacterium]|nr:NAD-dependent epimerase/dehydratase family protein [Thermomicrobiales bacterium]